ncbi:glycophorin-A [Hyaena hyaena]|uniref:glycophorin-A n=1 Tax=Hyaena hyaena TaxID=95912 RepID=UPI0019221E80|nr:glycophorin-A [Hyaena hyaena]
MYEKIIILTVLLFSGYSSSQETTESEGTESLPTEAMTHASPTVILHVTLYTSPTSGYAQGSEQLEHIFSAGEITGIVYAVMVGVVGTILSIAFCVKQLTKKSPPTPVQPAHPEDADPESSIEPRNPGDFSIRPEEKKLPANIPDEYRCNNSQ